MSISLGKIYLILTEKSGFNNRYYSSVTTFKFGAVTVTSMDNETLGSNFELSHNREVMEAGFRQLKNILEGNELNQAAVSRSSSYEPDHRPMAVVENPNLIHLIEAEDTEEKTTRGLKDGEELKYVQPRNVSSDPLTFHIVSPERSYSPFETTPESLIIYRYPGLRDYAVDLQDKLEREFNTEARLFEESAMRRGKDRAEYLEEMTEVIMDQNGYGPNGI